MNSPFFKFSYLRERPLCSLRNCFSIFFTFTDLLMKFFNIQLKRLWQIGVMGYFRIIYLPFFVPSQESKSASFSFLISLSTILLDIPIFSAISFMLIFSFSLISPKILSAEFTPTLAEIFSLMWRCSTFCVHSYILTPKFPMYKIVITTLVMALFQKHGTYTSNKITTMFGKTAKNLRFILPTICRRTSGSCKVNIFFTKT